MSEVNLEQLYQYQNDFINTRTSEINQLAEDVSSALFEFTNLTNREYGYSHTPVIVNSLEVDYNEIVANNPTLADLSAVGIRAELKHGDVINIQGNKMFVNGVSAENDYSFSGTNSEGGTEIVNVWYFENDNSLNLADCNFNVVETRVLNKLTPPTIDSSYYMYASEIFVDGYTITSTPVGTRKFVSIGQSVFNHKISDNIEYIESDATTIPITNMSPFRARYSLKKIYLPELTDIPTLKYISVFGVTDGRAIVDKYDVEIVFPKLNIIGGGSDKDYDVFNGIKTITLPESVQEIGRNCFYHNDAIILNCKNATSIHNNWCSDSPNSFIMCGDWGASINISVAAKNWTHNDYIDLLENKLRNMGSETRNITIPSAVLAELDEAVITAVTAKGWTLGGA